jgi:hypothetical protein
MKNIRFLLLFLAFATINSFGQTKSEQFVNSLVGNWVSSENANHSIKIKRENNVLLVTETTIQDNNKPYITESKIYLDGSLQKDGLKQSATEAKTLVKDSNLTTTFYGLKDGKTKELFKERLSVKNGNLILTAQKKFGVPFLAAQTKQTFIKSNNQQGETNEKHNYLHDFTRVLL